VGGGERGGGGGGGGGGGVEGFECATKSAKSGGRDIARSGQIKKLIRKKRERRGPMMGQQLNPPRRVKKKSGITDCLNQNLESYDIEEP